MPRIPVPGTTPVEYTDYFEEQTAWVEIPPDGNGDLNTGTEVGARFVVLIDPASSQRVVRVLADRLGIFRAYYLP